VRGGWQNRPLTMKDHLYPRIYRSKDRRRKAPRPAHGGVSDSGTVVMSNNDLASDQDSVPEPPDEGHGEERDDLGDEEESGHEDEGGHEEGDELGYEEESLGEERHGAEAQQDAAGDEAHHHAAGDDADEHAPPHAPGGHAQHGDAHPHAPGGHSGESDGLVDEDADMSLTGLRPPCAPPALEEGGERGDAGESLPHKRSLAALLSTEVEDGGESPMHQLSLVAVLTAPGGGEPLPAASGQWTCPICTFEGNEVETNSHCDMCGTPMPKRRRRAVVPPTRSPSLEIIAGFPVKVEPAVVKQEGGRRAAVRRLPPLREGAAVPREPVVKQEGGRRAAGRRLPPVREEAAPPRAVRRESPEAAEPGVAAPMDVDEEATPSDADYESADQSATSDGECVDEYINEDYWVKKIRVTRTVERPGRDGVVRQRHVQTLDVWAARLSYTMLEVLGGKPDKFMRRYNDMYLRGDTDSELGLVYPAYPDDDDIDADSCVCASSQSQSSLSLVSV